MADEIKKFKPMSELGVTGLKRFGGHVYEEFLTELSGTRAVKVYKEMSDNDPVVSAILFVIEMLIRNVEWRVEPYTVEKDDQAKAEFVEECLEDMDQPFIDTIAECLSFLRYGWSWHEIVYKFRRGESRDPTRHSKHNDGLIGWRKLPIRSQDSLREWVFSENGDVIAMDQQAPPDYATRIIPFDKSLLFRTTSFKANPESKSMLRGAYRPWFFKKHIENIEAIGIERDLAGYPVIWVPADILDPTAGSAEKLAKAEFERSIKNIRRDEQEGMLMPLVYDTNGNKVYDITLMSTGGRRQFDTTGIINRYDQRIAITSLADFILLGHEKVGSFALSSSKTDVFATAIGAWLQSIAQIFNRHGIPRLFAMNGWSTERTPSLVPGDIESVDLNELGEFITKLSGAGAPLFPNKNLENHLKKIAGLPVEDVDTDVPFTDSGRERGDDPSMIGEPNPKDLSGNAGGTPVVNQGRKFDGRHSQSMVGVVASVAKGEINRESGVNIIMTLFGVTEDEAVRIVGNPTLTKE